MEGAIALAVGAFEFGAPAVFEDPALEFGIPAGAVGDDLVFQLKRIGVQFEDVYLFHHALGGIEVLVVVNARSVALLPFVIGSQPALFGLAFNLVAQGFLPPVGGGHIGVIE